MCRWPFITLLFSHSLYAADTAQKQLGVNVSPLGADSLLSTVGGLLLVLGIIIGGAWLFKRYAQMPMGGKGMVRVVGGASVGTRERVIVVEVDNQRLLLGVAPGQVRTLHILQGSGQGFQNYLDNERGSGQERKQ
ncbi:MAG: flagellar biosynthetic protein FliO [Candidatus Thiodiazotropha sp. (ex Lucina aurantia)]|uniref:Flagellar protein n=2 Tax=Candidatus Thiodiazotropha TaxID=1913444 RepID=A0A7Z0VIU6_9GAMM|nr:flagellar biosynthetic protein FliO [Candidatus Thiodiazotropha endolucinida]MBT3017728.1 flagellar biosynthetic protein FliO [Candidatus Thiodiazotropha taylori]MBT3032599.1 flagellar biosynthetic protein FliO [Candidatus Thiodiazotropha sp. (ex Lucina pensylvanica)]MBT3040821.1 flagellar biosynthetic protein FliO [Candidatus Thiodiazotropha sp. (ex Codakia orbicularis)]MBV2103884.1 flagellar biosynthetic protein FliO [Candidatus Thiodiazotropha sp. (ex Lucina aurantia)]MBT3025027.1 flagel